MTVTGRRQADGMYFAVEDDGVGMNANVFRGAGRCRNGAPLDKRPGRLRTAGICQAAAAQLRTAAV